MFSKEPADPIVFASDTESTAGVVCHGIHSRCHRRPKGHCCADAVLCHLCDSIEGNCIGASCEGTACIKRVAFDDGTLRVAKMCQLSGADIVLEQCNQVPLWQGRFGVECICQSDWCNVAATITSKSLSVAILITLLGALFG
uniref:Activin_recp domain-containing protein n=1 Tax=Steinernema glaseri TaxID=37863 RepID=A0A1I7Z5K7_9BILA